MELVRPLSPVSPSITALTGITNQMVSSARSRHDVISDFLDFCEEDILIGHNVSFDYSFIKTNAAAEGFPFEKSGIDTLKIAQKVHKDLESRSLEYLCHYYHIETAPHTGPITMHLPPQNCIRHWLIISKQRIPGFFHLCS